MLQARLGHGLDLPPSTGGDVPRAEPQPAQVRAGFLAIAGHLERQVGRLVVVRLGSNVIRTPGKSGLPRSVPGRTSIPPIPDREYLAAVDMSGGASDSAALAIAHREGDRAVVDVVVERRAPHDPGDVTDFCQLLRMYHCGTVTGDRYAAEWCASAYSNAGVSYAPSERDKSTIYRDFVPIVMTGAVELPDDRTIVTQLARLERRVARGARARRSTIQGAQGTTSPTSSPWCRC
jgi:hypothetical protein